MKQAQGFTLIEMMISVAIIGILAAIAIPSYTAYIAKSETAAALYEITPSRTQFEVRINDGQTSVSVADIGLPTSSQRCSLIETDYSTTTGIAKVICTLRGSPEVIDRTITLTRSSAGAWSCVTGQGSAATALKEKYKPKGCI